MNIFDILEHAHSKALLNKLVPDEAAIWRGMLRKYSKTFNISIIDAEKMNPEDIALALYENQLDDLDLDDDRDFSLFMDRLYTLDDPNYDAEHDKEEEAANQKILDEENEKIAKKALKKANPKAEPKKELPKQGGINLNYLSKQQETEG